MAEPSERMKFGHLVALSVLRQVVCERWWSMHALADCVAYVGQSEATPLK